MEAITNTALFRQPYWSWAAL